MTIIFFLCYSIIKNENGWMDHVMKTKNQNPGLAFKEVLKLASKSYRKQSGGSFAFQSPLLFKNFKRE